MPVHWRLGECMFSLSLLLFGMAVLLLVWISVTAAAAAANVSSVSSVMKRRWVLLNLCFPRVADLCHATSTETRPHEDVGAREDMLLFLEKGIDTWYGWREYLREDMVHCMVAIHVTDKFHQMYSDYTMECY